MLERLRRKAQNLVWLEFKTHDRFPSFNLDISPEELQLELTKIPTPLFLGRYNQEQIRAKLERHKILSMLRAQGFHPLILAVESDGLIEHRIVIHTGEMRYDKILLELRLREGVFKVKEAVNKAHPELLRLLETDTVAMLWIDWLLLQNPFIGFNSQKPPLPEQKYPGLGILNLVVPLIGEFAQETYKQAVLDIPEHFHGAVFYARWMRFFNPEMEGKMRAILRDLSKYNLALISWGIKLGGLANTKKDDFEDWKPGEQIYALSPSLRDYFDSSVYQEFSERAYSENSYQLDFSRIKDKTKVLEPEEQAHLEIALSRLERTE